MCSCCCGVTICLISLYIYIFFICISLSNLLATWDFLLLSFFLFLACWAWVQQLDLDAYPLFDVFMTPRLRRVLLNVEQATAARRTPRDLLSTDLPIAPFHPPLPPHPHLPRPACTLYPIVLPFPTLPQPLFLVFVGTGGGR